MDTKKQLTIRERDGDFVFKIVMPRQEKRFNPHTEEASERGDLGSYGVVTGVIDERASEYGFAFTIDMDYKDKADQFSDFFLEADSFMERAEFEQMCKQHKIPLAILTA